MPANLTQQRKPVMCDMSVLRMRSAIRRRHSPARVTESTLREFQSFRERLCSSLDSEPVAATQAPTVTTATTASSNAIEIPRLAESTLSVTTSRTERDDGAEPEQVQHATESLESMDLDSDNEKPNNDKSIHKLKRLNDSQWAKEGSILTCTLKTLPSTTANTNSNTTTSPSQPRTQTPKQRRRGGRVSGRSKKEAEDPHREYTMRINMDMEEFQREVEELGLKTLKDSRWA
ncbi:hypothetical protein RRF57_005973 [Xylaria bambusicola]|uniref:Uncharacterized protein n=1 Tax=Xylaria bambusicola TaxID=326684 RepID=A0AAN7UPL7_9PEZI